MCYETHRFYCDCREKDRSVKCTRNVVARMLNGNCGKQRNFIKIPTTCGRLSCEVVYPEVPKRSKAVNITPMSPTTPVTHEEWREHRRTMRAEKERARHREAERATRHRGESSRRHRNESRHRGESRHQSSRRDESPIHLHHHYSAPDADNLTDDLNEALAAYNYQHYTETDYKPIPNYRHSAVPAPLANVGNRRNPPPAKFPYFNPEAPIRSSSKRKSQVPPSASRSHRIAEEHRGRDNSSLRERDSSRHRSSSRRRDSSRSHRDSPRSRGESSSRHHESRNCRELERSNSKKGKGRSRLSQIRNVFGHVSDPNKSSDVSFGCVDSNRIAGGYEAEPRLYRGNSRREPTRYVNGTEDVVYEPQGGMSYPVWI